MQLVTSCHGKLSLEISATVNIWGVCPPLLNYLNVWPEEIMTLIVTAAAVCRASGSIRSLHHCMLLHTHDA